MSGTTSVRFAAGGALSFALLLSAVAFAQVAPTTMMTFTPVGIRLTGVSR